MSDKFISFEISKKHKDKTILIFLKEKLNLSNKEIKYLLDKGILKLNGKIERFSSVKLKVHDELKLLSKYQKYLKKEESFKIHVIYEDEHILAIDKPINFVCTDENIHRFFPKEHTLIHRLDKDTSGVLLIAKNFEAKEKIIPLFLEKKIEKEYLAIVDGEVSFNEKKIENFLIKDKIIDGQTIYTQGNNGKYALSYFYKLASKKDFSLILANPITGRTHQLRVHLKKLNHPILGDFLYSKKFKFQGFVERLMLHSYKLSFFNPFTEEDLIIKSEIPILFTKYFDDIQSLV